jgi:hypothetical protein
MDFKDLYITPLYLILFYLIVYAVRPSVSNGLTKKYFIPALTVKFIGAISLGLIYRYYYGYGDTLRYFHYSKVIYRTLSEDFVTGVRLLFVDLKSPAFDLLPYFAGNYFFGAKDEGSFLIVRLCGLFGFFTGHSYFAMAIIFAAISFTGIWALYTTFYKLYPALYKQLAYAILFVPSLFFWGSGILKDTLTLGALGWLTYGLVNIVHRKRLFLNSLIIIISGYLISIIKIYIILCFIPAAIVWIFYAPVADIKSKLIKTVLLPTVIALAVPVILLLINKISEKDQRYSIENLDKTAKTTADWILYSSGENGSAYTLGDMDDFSTTGMIKKMPLAINVTLFRPYLWEVKNPVMLLAAIESSIILYITIKLLFKLGLFSFYRKIMSQADTLFLAIFSLSFAFAVGFSTYNFGSLVRYKIPCIPFFLVLIIILKHSIKRKQVKNVAHYSHVKPSDKTPSSLQSYEPG